MENQRAVAVLFIIGAFLAGVFFRSATLAVMGYASIEDPLLGGFVASSSVAGGVAGVIALIVLLRNEKATAFMDSVITELLNVTWPSREETFSNTGIVIGTTVFFSCLLASYDFLWAKLTGLFIYTTG